MDAFIETFGGVAALCLGVIILAVFFTILGLFKRKLETKIVEVKGFLKPGTRVNIHLAGGKILEDRKFVGFVSGQPPHTGLPHQFHRMMVLENPQGIKTYVKADTVQMIEEIKSVN
jgi:hypothetical protein